MEELDSVQRYAQALGLVVHSRTILVEGASDAELFQLAAHLELASTGIDLVGTDFAIVCAGERDRGGTRGVIRELVTLRGLGRTCLLPNGRPRYRFVALFDNDNAGRQAVKAARELDTSLLEYKDLFRLFPSMPRPGNLDPRAIERAFAHANQKYKGLDWEVEDLVAPSLLEAFVAADPLAVIKSKTAEDKVHREYTRDGKARVHRYIKRYAMAEDLVDVSSTLKAFRFYLGLPDARASAQIYHLNSHRM
ncbi:MAG TPA: hypothetical protein VED01_09295 [Burkholderiales bacterium]|nr:hypothetical protein [Burkholderiales bacterium]